MDIIGVDEVGRSSWAGPIVGCAYKLTGRRIEGVNDSKKLSEPKREALYDILRAEGKWAISEVQAWEIDKVGINKANQQVLRNSAQAIYTGKEDIVVDGKYRIGGLKSRAVVGGDGKVYEIMCASIIGKVYLDRYMRYLAGNFPEYQYYDWETNKGYGTPKHKLSIKRSGLSHEHRKSFIHL